MSTTLVLTATACLFAACMVYFFMEFRAHGERDKTLSNTLSLQATLAANTKKLKGYTRYQDYVAAGHQATAENARSLAVKVVREYVHVENLPKEKCKDGALVSLVLKYTVEYAIGVDLKPASFEVVATTAGIDIKTSRPGLIGLPVVKPVSHELAGVGVLLDEPGALKAIHEKFGDLALRYGAAVALEEPTRALCKLKMMEFLRDFLLAQAGVTHVPAISVVFK